MAVFTDVSLFYGCLGEVVEVGDLDQDLPEGVPIGRRNNAEEGFVIFVSQLGQRRHEGHGRTREFNVPDSGDRDLIPSASQTPF
jgi:hypothetical protein